MKFTTNLSPTSGEPAKAESYGKKETVNKKQLVNCFFNKKSSFDVKTTSKVTKHPVVGLKKKFLGQLHFLVANGQNGGGFVKGVNT